MLLIAATTLAPVNSACPGEARNPIVSTAAWYSTSASGGSKNSPPRGPRPGSSRGYSASAPTTPDSPGCCAPGGDRRGRSGQALPDGGGRPVLRRRRRSARRTSLEQHQQG